MTTKNVRRFSWKVRSRGTKPTARETVGLLQVPRYLPVCQRDESRGLDSAARLRLVPAISVPQQQTRRELRRFAIDERDLTVDHDVAVAAGALHSPPFAARKIVYHRAQFDPQTVVVVHDDVC